MSNQEENEITMKDVILSVQEYIKYILRKAVYIAIPVIIFGALFAYLNYTADPKCKTERKFFVENSGSGPSIGNLGGLLGSIGIRQGKSNPYQIIEVANSKLLTSEVLLSKVEDGQLLANWIIEEYNLDEKWAKTKDAFVDFRFKNDSLITLSKLERNAINKLVKRMGTTESEIPMRKIFLEEDRGYYSITTNTTNANLSLAIDQITYEKVRFFFEEKVLEDYKKNRDLLKIKVDSVDVLLKRKIFELANYMDSNRGAITYSANVKGGLLQKEVDVLSTAFQELTKNYEFADFTLKTQKPTFMLIDRSIPPIGINRPAWWKGLIRGGILGAFIGIGFFVMRKFYRDIMDDD